MFKCFFIGDGGEELFFEYMSFFPALGTFINFNKKMYQVNRVTCFMSQEDRVIEELNEYALSAIEYIKVEIRISVVDSINNDKENKNENVEISD